MSEQLRQTHMSLTSTASCSSVGTMNIKERINEKLLRDRQILLAPSKSETTPCFYALWLAFTALFLAKVDLHSFHLNPMYAKALSYFQSAIDIFAIAAWFLMFYYILVWFRVKNDSPELDGPFFRNSVPLIRRRVFHLMTILWVLLMVAPAALWSYTANSFFLNIINMAIYAIGISVFHSEVFRNLNSKKPWSDRKRITIAFSGAVVVFYISMRFYMQTRG